MTESQGQGASRRDFLKTTAVASGAAATLMSNLPSVHAAGSDTIKVGLIGCGGRGRGAAENCFTSSTGVKIHALGDAFADRVEDTKAVLADRIKDGLDVGNRTFVGLDAYKEVIASGVDLVILATPPGFRPIHIEAVIEAGKNLFTEKPVGVDGPGIRRVLAAYEKAKEKKIAVVAGTQRRHQPEYLESMAKIHAGEIGDVVGGRYYWNQGSLWHKDRTDKMSDVEWQIRNWLYFSWLSGDHIVEQHVHNLDVMNWVMKGHPVKAIGMGGREVRRDAVFGNIFDHHAIEYHFENGVVAQSSCRQIDGCEGNVSETVVGSKGVWTSQGFHKITAGGKTTWRFRGKKVDPYVQEHTDLINSIRSGNPLNELKTVAESTLTAIMGRMSTYTGKEVSWDAALNSSEVLMPANLAMDSKVPVAPVAVPGRTPLV